MSGTKLTTSKKPGEGQSARSVYDFLYNDSRRIGAFLSQFEPGHLQELKQTKSADQAQSRKSEKAGKAAVPGVIEGKITSAEETSSATGQGFERVFDPLWANARAFLDHLNENDLVQRDITQASFGQFVLVKGSLIIADMQMMRSLWDQPAIQEFLKHSYDTQQQAQADAAAPKPKRPGYHGHRKGHGGNKTPPTEADLALALLPVMSHSGHVHIVTEEYAVWGPAAEGALVSQMGDLVLKHGPKVAGEWSLLGILDALPYESGEGMTALEQVLVGMTVENVSKVPLQLAPFVRQALGRPLLSYGVTPLLIFREVAQRTAA
jgi:hypothetical protein